MLVVEKQLLMVLMDIYQPKSVSSLVDAMDRFINLPYEKKLKMGQNSRQKIETEFDERIVIKKYLDALREIM